MLNGLIHTHSGLRWILLALLVYAIWNAYSKMKNGSSFSQSDKRISFYALLMTHIQLLFGLALYFLSAKVDFSVEGFMKNTLLRFYMVEHIALMLIAVILITVGYSKAKNINLDSKKFKTIFRFYLIGLILILLGIPWPFRNLGAGWF